MKIECSASRARAWEGRPARRPTSAGGSERPGSIAARRPFGILLLAGMITASGCGGSKPIVDPSPRPPAPAPRTERPAGASAAPGTVKTEAAPGPFRFRDVRDGSGVDFVHVSGTTPAKLFPTANGSGVAVFDHDGDGLLDVYFATGNLLPLAARPVASNRLYRNLGGWKFQDVSEASGLAYRGYCHGIATGDLDNDGDADVFLANYGGDALFLNEGRGRFREITESSGILRPGSWSSSACFLDFDLDGKLDLYVSRYGDWQYPRDDRFCGDPVRKIRRYCSPKELTPVKHTLFRGDGQGRFTDVTDASGVGRTDGHGFAAVAADLDGDARPDLFVANDQDPRFLFLNRGDGSFRDATSDSGAAYDAEGRTQSGMGADAEDIDGDGRPELFVTNFQEEYNTLYRNLGPGGFVDATASFGLGVESLPWIGWGCALADLDNDGWPDIVVANGHIDDNAEVHGQPSAFAEPPLLHRNLEGRRFVLANRGAGVYFESSHVGHGLATGDLDNDGDLDLVVSHKDGPPALLRNDTPSASENSWLRFELVGIRTQRDAVGARVEVEAGGRTIVRLRKDGQSLMSSHDPRLLIGLGRATTVDRVRIVWPSGAVSLLEKPALRKSHRIVEPARTP
ncbi:MAG: CRTAC1 family protein [Isosphaeraceae bacterium]